MKVHETAEGQVVNAAVLVHGGDEGNDTAAEHGLDSRPAQKFQILSRLFQRKQARRFKAGKRACYTPDQSL
jgi:hypothetical protein